MNQSKRMPMRQRTHKEPANYENKCWKHSILKASNGKMIGNSMFGYEKRNRSISCTASSWQTQPTTHWLFFVHSTFVHYSVNVWNDKTSTSENFCGSVFVLRFIVVPFTFNICQLELLVWRIQRDFNFSFNHYHFGLCARRTHTYIYSFRCFTQSKLAFWKRIRFIVPIMICVWKCVYCVNDYVEGKERWQATAYKTLQNQKQWMTKKEFVIILRITKKNTSAQN